MNKNKRKLAKSIDYFDYRVVKRHLVDIKEDIYCIFEIYYDKNNNIISCVDLHNTPPMGATVEELRDDLIYYLYALTKDILNYEDLPK